MQEKFSLNVGYPTQDPNNFLGTVLSAPLTENFHFKISLKCDTGITVINGGGNDAAVVPVLYSDACVGGVLPCGTVTILFGYNAAP